MSAISRRVVVVDDDAHVRTAMCLRLKTAGYETYEAADGEAAVDMVAQLHPDAVILDVRMPRLDGLGALSALQSREDTIRIPVIMVSASLSDQKSALDHGARYFLRKPYQGERLLCAIDSAIRNN